jgi:hypothetical protein
MTFFILSNIFLEALQLHIFKKKILDTHRDATVETYCYDMYSTVSKGSIVDFLLQIWLDL